MTGTSDAAAVGSISHILKTAFKDVYDDNNKKEEAIRRSEEIASKKEARRLIKEAEAAAASVAQNGESSGLTLEAGEDENKDDDITAPLITVSSPPRLSNILPNLKADLDRRQQALDDELQVKLSMANRLKEYMLQEKEKAHEAELEEEDNLKKQGIMIGQHIPPLPSKLAVSAEELASYGNFSSNLQVAREMVESNKVNMLRRTGNLPISDLAEQKKTERAAKLKGAADANKPHYVQDTFSMNIKKERAVERYAAITEARRLEESKKYSQTGGVRPRYQAQYKKVPNQLTGDEVEAAKTIQRRLDHKMNYLRNPHNIVESVEQLITTNHNEYSKNNKELTRLAGTSGPGYGPNGIPLSELAQQPVVKKAAALTSEDLKEAAKAMQALANMGLGMSKAKRASEQRPVSPDSYEAEKLSPGISKVKGHASDPPDDDNASGSTFEGGFGFAKVDETKKVALPLFKAEPAEILFNEFQVGSTLTATITFTNISRVSRMVRIIPPSAPQYSLAPIKYPVNSKAGMCAPGMAVSTIVTFYPETLAEVVDHLTVETESGSYEVPIIARRDSPKLSLPATLNVGTCLVGDAMRVQVKCQNTGGPGKFRVVREEDFNEQTGKVVNSPTFGGDTNPNNAALSDDEPDWEALGCLRMNPFTLYPVRFDLQKMESVNIIIEFVPLELREKDNPFTYRFFVLSDNLQVFEYTLVGRSRQVDCYISEVNTIAFDHKNPQVRREIFFEAANIGVEQSQQIVVTNDSGLPVEYEWVWLDPSSKKGRPITDERDLTTAGRAKLADIEAKQVEWATMAPSPMGSPGAEAQDLAINTFVPSTANADSQQEQRVIIAGYQVSPLDQVESIGVQDNKKPITASTMGAFTPQIQAPDSPMGVAKGNGLRNDKANNKLRPLSGTPLESRARNAVKEQSFELSPARGVLGADGAETFTITFVPSSVPLVTMQAVLMLKRVPEVAVQNNYQASNLSKLQHEGHGHFTRLLSWIDQMSERADLQAYQPVQSTELSSNPASPPIIKTKLVNLKAVLDMVYHNASGYVLPSDVFFVERGVRLILAHVHLWRKRELDPEEDDTQEEQPTVESSAHGDDPLDDVKLALFMWDGPSGSAPQAVEPVSLKHSHIDLDDIYALYAEEAEKKRIDALGAEYNPEAEAAAKAAAEEELLKAPKLSKPLAVYGEPLAFSLPLLHALRNAGSDESAFDVLGVPVVQGEFVSAEEHLLARVWLEPETVLHLFGHYVNEILDLQVKHEAVDYLREKALQTFSCLTFNAAGEGKPQVVRVTPPLLSVGGLLPIEQTWKGQVRLINTSTAMAEVEFRPDQMEIVCLGTDGRRREEDSIADAIAKGGSRPLLSIAEEGSQVSIAGLQSHLSIAQGSQVGIEAGGSIVSKSSLAVAAQTSVISEVDAAKIQIEFDPPRILLMPEADALVNMFATVFCLGRYEVSIPLRSSANSTASQNQADTGGAQIDRVHLAFQSTGPSIRFLDPEIDLGLVGVGGTTSTTFSFVNEGASAVAFNLSALSEEQMNAVANEKASSIGPDGFPKQRSVPEDALAVKLSTESEADISVADINGVSKLPILETSDSKIAILTVEPASGTVASGEKVTVRLNCKGGTNPQRVRGCVKARIGSAMKEVDSTPDQYIGYRCEVQAPKTILYPMDINVGDVYTGVPVYFDITTENICNLPTTYTLERPALADFTDFRLTFDKPSGPLGPKEKVRIRCEFVALQPGIIDQELIANRIKGVPIPLGFVISGNARAPLVDLWPLDGSVTPFAMGSSNSQEKNRSINRRSSNALVPVQNGLYANIPCMPLPLANPAEPRFPYNSPVPEPLEFKPMVFASSGKDSEPTDTTEVALYERCVRQFAIRNLSAVPVAFELSVLKYAVHGNVGIAQLSDASGQESTRSGAETGARTSNGNGVTKLKSGTASVKPQGPLLVAHEDGANKFHSIGGQKFAEASVQRRENRLFLTSGLGASYLIYTDATRIDKLTVPLPGGVPLPNEQSSERTGYIDPWGVALVTVRTFNDMPGNYDDTLVVQFRDLLGLSWTKDLQVALKMTVSGCPLTIDKSTYGMTKDRIAIYNSVDDAQASIVPDISNARASTRDMLSFGVNTFDCEPVVRELYVQNNGSMPGKVCWRLCGVASGHLHEKIKSCPHEGEESAAEEEPLQQEDKGASLLCFWCDNGVEHAFKVEPSAGVIPAYGKLKFKVTLVRTTLSGSSSEENSVDSEPLLKNNSETTELAQLVGDVTFVAPEGANAEAAQEDSMVSGAINSSPSVDKAYQIQLLLQGKLVFPTIVIDKHVYTAVSSETIVRMEEGGIKFKSEANSIFGLKDNRGKRGVLGSGDDIKECSKIISLVNPLATMLVCSVSTEGQFALKLAADDSRPKGESAGPAKETHKALMSKSVGSVRTAVGAESLGRTITLLPRASVSFVLAFQPSRNMRETVAAPKLATAASSTNEEQGQLIVSFSTGQRLFLPLLGTVATPFIVGSSPKLHFGVCKVGFSTEGTMLVSNPTTVLARWVVKHVPVPNDSRNARKKENEKVKIKVPGYEYPPPEIDDPTVFLLTPSAGSVEGPTVSVTAAIAAPPKDLNRAGADIEVVPQRLSQTSWATETLTLKDTMDGRHDKQGQFEADARYPLPIQVQFRPKDNKVYMSRFRFNCEYGNQFDVLLYGTGTYEEHEHMPLSPKPE